MSSFDKALEDRTLLRDLLKNDDNERQFRVALRNKEEKLLAYLSNDTVLEDMVKALVDEEDRSLQEASEVLGILLANLDEVTDAFVGHHLPSFFSYLDRETMNPRRLYYFLRVASFLFQNRTPELFHFVEKDTEFTSKLVKHLSSVHIMQLVLNMLKLEDQMKDQGFTECNWSVKTNLIGHVVKALQSSPSNNLESVNKLMTEIIASYNINSEFMKSILLAEEGALIRTLVTLTKMKSVSAEAIKLLDEIVFKIIMSNKDDEQFFLKVSEHFKQEQEVFSQMLKSESLGEVLVGVKFVHALIKHRALFLLGDGLVQSIQLFFRFPWSNILHNVITEMICHVFQHEEEELIRQLLESGLLRSIVNGLTSETPVGYLPHLRAIASAMAETRSIPTQEILGNDPLWERYIYAMEFRNDKNLTFKEAERKVVEALKEKLEGKETTKTEESTEVGGESTVAHSDTQSTSLEDRTEELKEEEKPSEPVAEQPTESHEQTTEQPAEKHGEPEAEKTSQEAEKNLEQTTEQVLPVGSQLVEPIEEVEKPAETAEPTSEDETK